MPQFAANLSLMYTELPFLDRFAAAARDRFTAVEFLFPYAFERAELAARLSMPASVCYDIAELKASILALVQPGDQIVIMSNGAFGGIHQQLLEALS